MTTCDYEDSKDSDDEGWLRDGHVKYRPEVTLQGRAAFRPARVDPRMDPADLPEYLQLLMEGVADDLTLQQREELAAAIYEYRDVFSSGPTDMGRTGLVKHTIDTGDQRPIRLPPRRLPITKQEVEKEEVQQILDRGAIVLGILAGSDGPTRHRQDSVCDQTGAVSIHSDALRTLQRPSNL